MGSINSNYAYYTEKSPQNQEGITRFASYFRIFHAFTPFFLAFFQKWYMV